MTSKKRGSQKRGSKRKSGAGSRKKRGKKGGTSRASSGVSPFARVGRSQPAPFVFKRATTRRVENERRQVERLLISRGVASDIAHQIAYDMNPDLYYLLRIWGLFSSDPDDEGSPDMAPVLQAMYVGSGRRLWARCIGYAAKAPIQHVEINRLDPSFGGVVDRPLWDQYSVTTIEGDQVYGHGKLDEWKTRLKEGRPKKAVPGTGKMTAEERRKFMRAKNAAIRRRQEFNRRYEALRDKDAVAAQRMLERSKRNRKGYV